MSATNATTNYSLPLFIGTDKPAWLVDWNTAMTDIDGQMKVNATAIQANATSISGLSTTVSAHTTSISTITSEISTLSTGLNSAQGSINTIQSLIGNGEPTTTDKTLIGAINEIYGMITGGGDAITADNVVYDNTTSGLSATDVQAAIDEVYAAIPAPGNIEADDVAYDNTDSGLAATNVQDAIDELAQGGTGASIVKAVTTNQNVAVHTSDYQVLDSYTVVDAGIYVINGFIDLGSGSSTNASLAINNNASLLAKTRLEGYTGNAPLNVSCTVQLAANDVVTFEIQSSRANASSPCRYTITKL